MYLEIHLLKDFLNVINLVLSFEHIKLNNKGMKCIGGMAISVFLPFWPFFRRLIIVIFTITKVQFCASRYVFDNLEECVRDNTDIDFSPSFLSPKQ